MSKKDDFKIFVKNNPTLIKYVRNNQMTWQKFYEIYDLYGEDKKYWDEYLTENNTTSNELLNFIKGINTDSIKEGLNTISKAINVLSSLSTKEEIKDVEYKPRPLYKHFED